MGIQAQCRKFKNANFSFIYALLLFLILHHIYGKAFYAAIEESDKNDQFVGNESDPANKYVHIVLNRAKEMHIKEKTIIFSVVNNAYIPFVYSWLCNTLYMDVHSSVLLVTTDKSSNEKLTKDWPNLNVINLDTDLPQNNQFYSHVGYLKILVLRSKLMTAILEAGIDIMLSEFDSLWIKNPVPIMRSMTTYDLLVHQVAGSNGWTMSAGFLYIFATESSKRLFRKLNDMMVELEEELSKSDDSKSVSIRVNDQEFFSKLVRERYGGISVYFLPFEEYPDGVWYRRSKEERDAMSPLVIQNNFILGNRKKIKRAKQWHHWFLRGDNTCDTVLVNRTVIYTN